MEIFRKIPLKYLNVGEYYSIVSQLLTFSLDNLDGSSNSMPESELVLQAACQFFAGDMKLLLGVYC